MPERSADWLMQAQRDLEHARHAAAGGFHEWACFSAQQSAEKALKALHQHARQEVWGHSVRYLLEALPAVYSVTEALLDCGRVLDRFYIPTRYPSGFDRGKPGDYYVAADSEVAFGCTEAILRFCAGFLSG